MNDRVGTKTSLPLAAGICLAMLTPAAAQLNCNVGIEFYPKGPIKRCNLNGHHKMLTIAGETITCVNGQDAILFPNGGLKSCTIGEPHTFGDNRCEADARVEFSVKGTLLRCR